MKIDKKKIDMILKLNDDQLWKTMQLIGAKSGFEKIKSFEKPKDMSKIRNTLSSLTNEDISRISELIKKDKGNGWDKYWRNVEANNVK